jgi:hypothetical protein
MTNLKPPTAKRHSSRPAWKPGKYITLRNVSDRHILLALPTGHLRLDKGRALRFTADVVNVETVRKLIDAGEIRVEG